MKSLVPRLVLLASMLPGSWLAAEELLVADAADGAGSYNYDTGDYLANRLGDSGINIGRQGPQGVYAQAAVFPFQLPDFGAVAEPFQTAEFSFWLNGETNSAPDIDLYALPARTASSVLPASASTTEPGDFYMGGFNGWPADDASPGVVKIQDGIITGTTPAGSSVTTNNAAGEALANYLNAAYDNGAGAGKWVFLRLSADAEPAGVAYYSAASADNTNADARPRIRYNFEVAPPRARPFIWVTNADKPGILDKIATQSWAASQFAQLQTRAADNLASHQGNRDAYLRELPVDWGLTPARYRTTQNYTESEVRGPSESKFNAALDCAILYYLTGDTAYAELAGDVLHNVVTTLIQAPVSTNANNGGWIFYTDFLKGARVTGTQLAVVYDFLFDYLQDNNVYDVQTGGTTGFAFTEAQAVFRQYYQLARDRGYPSHTNWHALMATCMLNNLLALDDETEREAALELYLLTGANRQKSLAQDYSFFSQPGDIWPESLQYAGAVPRIRSSHMVLIDRYDPSLDVFANYPNFPASLSRVSELTYPNHQLIRFGDGPRAGGSEPVFDYELVYQQAVTRGNTALAEMMGGRINAAVEAGAYDRATLSGYNSLGRHNEPLSLLWGAPEIPEPPMQSTELPRTDRLPFAGITLQRNFSALGGPDDGLMGFVGGAGFVHSHASGMSMELYGLGEILGAKGGKSSYGSALHENYYRTFAANNTVIVNGGSRGQGGWQNIGINTVQNLAMEPQVSAAAVSSNHSFSVSSFSDNKANLANATQQRTLAVVRTSPVSGFYVDFFRSESPVTDRSATTLDGTVTDQYHDYIYRNVGELDPEVLVDGAPAVFAPQPSRFQNDIGDAYQQPGWRYFENTQVTHPTQQSMRARFVANTGGDERCMTMHMPAVATREIAMVESPPITDAPSPYAGRNSPTLVIRQIGEAWDKPFAAVYEPHFGSGSGTVQNVSHLERGGVVVGVKVESLIQGVPAVHYVIANPGADETYEDPSTGFSFSGRFGIAADLGNGFISLYLGEGASMTYRGRSLATQSGGHSQAEVRFVPGQEPDVTANTPVTFSEPPAPTVSAVEDRQIRSAQAPLQIPFTVDDATGDADSLTVAVVSSNPLLFPEGSLVVSGSGTERILTLTPAEGIYATATVTITAANEIAYGGSSFDVTVESGINFTGVLPSLAEDAAVRNDGVVDSQTYQTGGIGAFNNTYDRCVVFVFQLPDFGQVDSPFVETTFSFDYSEKTNSARPTDLYAIAVRDTPEVLGSDYYGQTADPDPASGAVRLQEVILDNSTSLGILTSSFEADLALADYLNAAYDSGAGAGKYVFLRLNSTVPLSGANRAHVHFSEGGDIGPPDTRPHISFSAALPEGPTVSTPDDLSVPVGTTVTPVEVTLGGGAITLTATSSNQALLPDGQIVITGQDALRQLELNPEPHTLGTTTLTLTADDGNETASTSFELTVTGDATQRWRFEQFGTSSPEGDAAPGANPDGDSFDNADEYTLGTDPQSPEPEPLLSIQVAETPRSIEFLALAAEGPGYDGLIRRYTVEHSEKLTTWDDLTGATGIIGANQPVTVDLPAGKDTGFCRLRVWLE